MRQIEALIRFAEATFFLVLATFLVVTGFIFSEGGKSPIAGIMVYVGFFLTLPGLFCGIDGFLRLRVKETQNERKE